MRQKGFAPIIVVIIIILVIAGVAVAYSSGVLQKLSIKKIVQPTNKEQPAIVTTTDWKTYKNGQDSFIFKYPSDFSLIKTASLSEVVMGNSNNTLSVEWNRNVSEYKDWINDIKDDIKKEDEPHVKMSMIDNNEVFFESRMSAEGVFERNVIFLLDKSIIHLNLSADTGLKGNEEPDIYSKVEDLADLIISTFKFTQ